MIKLEIYDRTGVLETYKLEYLPDVDRFKTQDDIIEYIDQMEINEYKKVAYRNRLWVILDWCHPDKFYRIYMDER